EALPAEIAETTEMPVRLHPSLADHYRDQIHRLRNLLQGDGARAEAVDILRSLIDRIELSPVELEDGRKTLTVSLHGSLAGILSLSLGGDNALKTPDVSGGVSGPASRVVKLVAGAGFDLCRTPARPMFRIQG
ncbi:MAG: hypothetical protein AAFU49_24820, partial [Pseudomonadota bacterium]